MNIPALLGFRHHNFHSSKERRVSDTHVCDVLKVKGKQFYCEFSEKIHCDNSHSIPYQLLLHSKAYLLLLGL